MSLRQWYLEYSEDFGRTFKRVDSGLPDNVYPGEAEAQKDAEYLLVKWADRHFYDDEDPDPDQYQVYVVRPDGTRYRYQRQ